MDAIIDHHEQKDKRRGRTASTIGGIAVLILIFLPLLRYPIPPPGQEGILVNLGLPDLGQGTDNAGPSAPAVADPVEEDQPEEQPQEDISEPTPPIEEAPDPNPVEEEVITTEDPDEVALREQERREQQRKEQERLEEIRKQQEAEAERRRQEEEARKRAEAEAQKQAEADELKDKLGGLFGDGKGKGDTGKEGNQGDPEGDPDASKLEGVSTGSGTVGGGLGNRGVTASPRITDRSQDQGIIVVRVCVDKSGNVISSEFTQRGTTSSSARLKKLAVENAKKWKFSQGSVDKQCGTITYNFRVQ